MITPVYASLLAFLYIAISASVIRTRFREKVSLGDGENDNMLRHMRAHGNFAEYVPFALLLILMLELQSEGSWLIHITALLLLAGRLLHANGILFQQNTVNQGRRLGMVMTFMSIIITSLANLFFALT